MKDIKDYEGLYAVTSCGKVWSHISKRFLKPATDRYGYLWVNLYKNGKKRKFTIHRLVAEAYVPNPDNLETVDHIDENKEHNYVNNLRWMSREDNSNRSHNKQVKCLETGEIFESIIIAAKEKGLNQSNISKACRGKYKTCGGYHWEVNES